MMRRTLVMCTLAGLVLSFGGSVQAAEQEKAFYTYGSDRSSWFWKKQFNQQIGGPDAPGGITHRQGLPSPQSGDTRPVAAENGDLEKVSAIYFDLVSRGVEPGSTITKFVITFTEDSDRNEHPQFNAGGKKIQACKIEEFWPSGEAEVWNGRPSYDQKACEVGTRKAGKNPQDPATWTFDITSIAEEWGADSFSNNGVILLPVLEESGPAATWQINLKIPARDDDVTPDDEYKKTRDRVVAVFQYEPGAQEDLFDTSDTGTGETGTTFTAPSTTFGPSTTTTTTTTDFGGGTTTAAPPPAVPADTGQDTSEAPPAEEAPPEQAPVAQITPEMPAYVWALIPLGLLAIAAVRSVIMEPTRGIRPDGVVATILRLNAARRGVPAAPTSGGPGSAVREAWGRARRWLTKVTRSRRA